MPLIGFQVGAFQSNAFQQGTVGPGPVSIGTYRFLKDHSVNNEYIFAGEIRNMFTPWQPTADVEPLDTLATTSFYNAGPTLGAVIRPQFSAVPVYAPVTYWRQISPNVWVLTGLGSALAPINVQIGRIEDKSE